MSLGPCSECHGSRHVWNGSKWVSCSCLAVARKVARYREAGVPLRYDDETWRTFVGSYSVKGLDLLITAAKALRRGDQPEDWILLHGRPSRARSLAEALVMRAACDGGLDARAVDLPGLIDVEFEKGRGGEIYGFDVLALEVGRETPNKWNRVVIEKAIRKRWGDRKFMLLIVHGEPSRLGSLYKSGVVEEALAEKFQRVRVGEKE